MSNRPKPRRSHRPWPTPGPGEGYAALPAIVPDRTVPGAREQAQQITHDRLIRLWGPARRSGIWWTERPGAAGAKLYRELCESVGQEVEPDAAEALRNPRALVVVAWAITTEGPSPNPPEKGHWVRPS